ncbi:CoA transferase [Proteus mirabilis]
MYWSSRFSRGCSLYTSTRSGKNNRSPELYDLIWQQVEQKTASEWADIFTKNDIPFSIAQTWEEVLEDKQAWAINTFYHMKYKNGSEKPWFVHRLISWKVVYLNTVVVLC